MREINKKFVKVCPQCGSTNIGIPNMGLDIEMSFKDRCRECGAIGNFIEVEKSKVKEFQKKLKK